MHGAWCCGVWRLLSFFGFVSDFVILQSPPLLNECVSVACQQGWTLWEGEALSELAEVGRRMSPVAKTQSFEAQFERARLLLQHDAM
jgi:hypothetical protein